MMKFGVVALAAAILFLNTDIDVNLKSAQSQSPYSAVGSISKFFLEGDG